MSEPVSVNEPTPAKMAWHRVYSLCMLGVLILFAVCEWFLWVWGHDASVYAVIGGFVACLFGTLRYCRVYRSWTRDRAVAVLMTVFFLFMFVALLLPAIQAAPEAARRMECCNNMKQLCLALNNYYGDYHRFPPAFIADEAGKPMHSWRTLLLPYLGEKRVYDAYDFKKPWSSPENMKLAAELSWSAFQCPSVSDLPDRLDFRTDYVAVLGDDTFWPSDGTSRTEEDIQAGLNNVAILIEINNSDIAWNEPRDVKLDDFLSGKLSWSKTGVHGGWSVFHAYPLRLGVVFADGHVQFFSGEPTPDQLRRLFSITEPFDRENENFAEIADRPIVFRHVVFYVWLAMLVMQFVYIFFPVGKPGKG